MSYCKGCGQPIDWVRTHAGKNMPIDPEPVYIITGEGRDKFVTDEGEVLSGRLAKPKEISAGTPVAFIPHWATCPEAGRFKK